MRRRSAPSAAIRRSVPVRTFDGWDDPPPGFVEADLVAHSGPVATGSFVQTLVLTDIATGLNECAPLLVREQRLLTEVLGEMFCELGQGEGEIGGALLPPPEGVWGMAAERLQTLPGYRSKGPVKSLR